MPFALIFISGGAILALELLASRIMTPYFGVSLYIWTSILSITLTSLALGYWWGGWLAGGKQPAMDRKLGLLFAIMPALAGIAIVAACLLYPYAFLPLARWSLIGGAFAACMILLFLPLVATSAMNPLLVALLLRRQAACEGDAGAGLVFFVSTLGSVAGVIATAFLLIPNISNFTAILLIALLLGALSLTAAALPKLPMSGRGAVIACGIIAMIGAVLLAWQGDRYTGRQGQIAFSGIQWRVEGVHSSLFGTVKILRSGTNREGNFLRMYFHDGLVQNATDSNQRSIVFYTYALEALARAYQPQPQRVLMLGAGIVPSRLARDGARVEVVEIDPASLAVAQRYFGFDSTRITTHQADARTFVSDCAPHHDVVLVDLFHGDGTPDYLITREFFRDLRRCLTPGGIVVFNTFVNLDDQRAYAHLLATLTSELPHAALYRPDTSGVRYINSFLVAAPAPLPAPQHVMLADVPERLASTLSDMLAKPQTVGGEHTASGKIIHDAWNAAALDMAASQSAFRRSVLDTTPAALLLN